MIKPDEYKFKKGTYVRVSLLTEPEYKKDKFRKKYTDNWTKEIYKVVNVSKERNDSPIIQYRIADIDGNKIDKIYYYDQLLEVEPDKLIVPKN
jgi:hypothetical protein